MADDPLIQAQTDRIRDIIHEELGRVTDTATVTAVNPDDTLMLDMGGAFYPATALASYSPRAKGDIVAVQRRALHMVVIGKIGAPSVFDPNPVSITISDAAAPGGAGWQQIGTVYAKENALWLTRGTPVGPGTAGTITKTAIFCDTWRGGSWLGHGVAEQGDYGGFGQHTGVWVFGGGAWAGLAGKTITGCRIGIQRVSRPHGSSYGGIAAVLLRHDHADISGVATPVSIEPAISSAPLALGEATTISSASVPDLLVWAESFKAGTAEGVMCQAPWAGTNAEYQPNMTISVDYA